MPFTLVRRAHSSASLSLLIGVLTALASLRLWLDLAGFVHWAPVVGGIGFLIGWAWPAPRWTLCGLFIYLARPVPLPHLAVWVIALAAAGWIVTQTARRTRWEPAAPVGVGLLALLMFLLTLAPGVFPGDAGEFQVVTARWGVAHPPGYPLYTVLAGLVARLLPVKDMAWRVNLFSALTGAAAVSVIAWTIWRETGNPWAGGLAGGALWVSYTFWMTCTQASIRPLAVLFTVLMVEAALAYRRGVRAGRKGWGALVRFGLAAGFGATHHGSLVFAGGVLALGIAAADRRAWRQWPVAGLSALTGGLPLLYFLIRHDGFLAPAGLDTWNGFWHHALARGFAGDALGNLSPDRWPEHWTVIRAMFALQWPVGVTVLGLLGLGVSLVRDRWLGLTLIGGLIAHTAVSITYPASPMAEYLLPSYTLLVVAFGWLLGTVKRRAAFMLNTVALAALLLGSEVSYQSARRVADRAGERRGWLVETLRGAPEGALILAPWHFATPLWYLQQAERIRPDVTVRYIAPRGAESPMDTWTHAIQQAAGTGQPLLVLQNFPESYRHLPYTFENARVLPTPSPVPAGSEAIPLGRHALSTGWEWVSTDPGHLVAGQTARLRLTWHLGEPVPYGSLTTFVHLGLADQPPVGQVDLPLQAPTLVGSSGRVSIVYDLPIPLTTPPGEWTVFVGAYTPAGPLIAPDGQPRVRLATVRVHPAELSLPTQHRLAIDFPGARLRGWDYDTTLPNAWLLYLHWDLREPDRQYTVELEDTAGGRWAAVNAITQGQAGYWTSLHVLPPSIASRPVRVWLGDGQITIPAAEDGLHYIPFGNAAVLVGWDIRAKSGQVESRVDLLPVGGVDTEIKLHFEIVGDSWSEPADFIPVRGQLPAYRWAFNRRVRSQQTITVRHGGPVREVGVLLYDGYNGQRAYLDPRYETEAYPGVRIFPD